MGFVQPKSQALYADQRKKVARTKAIQDAMKKKYGYYLGKIPKDVVTTGDVGAVRYIGKRALSCFACFASLTIWELSAREVNQHVETKLDERTAKSCRKLDWNYVYRGEISRARKKTRADAN